MKFKAIMLTQKRIKTLGANHQRGKLWKAMRMLREFTSRDLLAVCEMEERKRGSIQAYLSLLNRVGYVRMTRTGMARSYRLIRNTGPLPPLLLRNHTIFFDQNTQEEIPYVKNP